MAEARDLKSLKCGFESHLDYVNEKEEALYKVWNECREVTGWGGHGTKKFVPGDGNLDADIVFVGEAPGRQEDKEGKPFVGPSGQLLNQLIEERLELNREDVYTTNVVKVRPTDSFGNRPPTLQEKYKYTPFLIEELLIINPRLIIPLGGHSLNIFFPLEKISNMRGRHLVKELRGRWYNFVPTYHPSYALRSFNGKEKGKVAENIEQDFNTIKTILNVVKDAQEE